MIRKIKWLKIIFKRIFRRIKYIPTFIKESIFWECETCQTCGNSFRIKCLVKDEIWDKVTETTGGTGGSYCVDCFIKKAEKKGVLVSKEDLELDPFYPRN